jgi:hypothetical protein
MFAGRYMQGKILQEHTPIITGAPFPPQYRFDVTPLLKVNSPSIWLAITVGRKLCRNGNS